MSIANTSDISIDILYSKSIKYLQSFQKCTINLNVFKISKLRMLSSIEVFAVAKLRPLSCMHVCVRACVCACVSLQ